MPYFHVLAAFERESNTLEAVFMDLTEQQLRARFLKPYKGGQNLVSGNRLLQVREMRKVHIVRTEDASPATLAALQKSSREEIDKLNREGGIFFVSIGRGYTDVDILEVGEDVTAHYITSPPGTGADSVAMRLLKWFLTNMWVVGGGVAAAGIAWWFGWH